MDMSLDVLSHLVIYNCSDILTTKIKAIVIICIKLSSNHGMHAYATGAPFNYVSIRLFMCSNTFISNPLAAISVATKMEVSPDLNLLIMRNGNPV